MQATEYQLPKCLRWELPKGSTLQDVLRDYIVLDLETTGNTRLSRITEIAAIRYANGKELSRFHSMVNPGQEIPPQVVKLTGITQADVENAPYIQDIADDIIRFLGDLPIVGHNALDFDKPVLERRTERFIVNPIIDTLELAREIFPGLDQYKLESLKKVLGLNDAPSHRAMNDVIITNDLFLALINPEQYKDRVAYAIDHPEEFSVRKPRPRPYRSSEDNVSIKDIQPTVCVDSASFLYGKTVVFTGLLSISRKDSMQIAVNAGAVLKNHICKKTNYLVVGTQDTSVVGESGTSRKQRDAQALNESGAAHIEIITEEEFLRLAQEKKEDPMLDQLTMDLDTPDTSEERQIFELIYPAVQDVVMNLPIDGGLLNFKELQNCSSVYLLDQGEVFFRIRMRRKLRHILVAEKWEYLLPKDTPVERSKSDSGMIRIPIAACSDVLAYAEALRSILILMCKEHADFGCCGRYMACSDAKTCIHPDPQFALQCIYRYNMLDGKIFYGENKNI